MMTYLEFVLIADNFIRWIFYERNAQDLRHKRFSPTGHWTPLADTPRIPGTRYTQIQVRQRVVVRKGHDFTKFEREMCELKWFQQQHQCKTNNLWYLRRVFKGLEGDTLRIHQNVDMISFFVGNIVSCTLVILRRMTRLRDRLANESVN
jgi:hypothetical protein